jgi:transporter family-2 protein
LGNSQSILLICVMMLLTGVGIPIMAAMNANLGQHVGGPVAATAILFGVGFIISAAIIAVTGAPSFAQLASGRPIYYLGAGFMVFYALAITFAAPRIGVGNAVFFVLLGQLIASATIDHFGLFGAITTAITPRRLIGIALMAAGVYMARKI